MKNPYIITGKFVLKLEFVPCEDGDIKVDISKLKKPKRKLTFEEISKKVSAENKKDYKKRWPPMKIKGEYLGKLH